MIAGCPVQNRDVRLLLVEDELLTIRMLAKGLREHAYAVDVARSGREALGHAADNDYDVVILDLGLPDADGLDVCRQLREAGTTAPILILTARDAVGARIAGLDNGADDYLLKPFDLGELLARLRALIRRGARPPLAERLHVGALVLDTRTQQALLPGRRAAAHDPRVRAAGVHGAPCRTGHHPRRHRRARVGQFV